MKFYAYASPRIIENETVGWQSYVIAESENGSRRRSPVRRDEDYDVSLTAAQTAANVLQRWHTITGREPLSFSFDVWEPMISVDPAEPVV